MIIPLEITSSLPVSIWAVAVPDILDINVLADALELTPHPGIAGDTTITVTVDNGHHTASTSFEVHLVRVMPPPPEMVYASPMGTTSGDGSKERPWSLDIALREPGIVDTLYLRGGKYKLPGSAQYKSTLTGTPDNYITVKPAPKEHAVIDGGLWVDPSGSWVVYRDLEIINSITKRTTTIAGSHPADITMTNGVAVYTDQVKVINNHIHDNVQGIASQDKTTRTVISGNIISDNGFVGPDRGHGHGVYVQNETGSKVIEDNIIFNNFGEYGIHLYGEQAALINISVIGNVVFNNQVIVSSGVEASGVVLDSNYLYNSKVLLTGWPGKNKDLTFTNNYIAGSFEVGEWDKLNFSGNTIYSPGNYVIIAQNRLTGARTWDNNHYYVPDPSRMFSLNSGTTSWDGWRAKTGYDQHSTMTVGVPSDKVFIRPNKYQPGRANIVIYNWSKAPTVAVDISSAGLAVGQAYTMRQVQNYNADKLQGVYDGKFIVVPMTGWTVAIPNGFTAPRYANTMPLFGCFVLEADNG